MGYQGIDSPEEGNLEGQKPEDHDPGQDAVGAGLG